MIGVVLEDAANRLRSDKKNKDVVWELDTFASCVKAEFIKDSNIENVG